MNDIDVLAVNVYVHIWALKQCMLMLCTFLSNIGCTPLILAATAGHASTVEILLDHGADIEAQSDRTKDTALSLACSGGRQEVGFLISCCQHI